MLTPDKSKMSLSMLLTYRSTVIFDNLYTFVIS